MIHKSVLLVELCEPRRTAQIQFDTLFQFPLGVNKNHWLNSLRLQAVVQKIPCHAWLAVVDRSWGRAGSMKEFLVRKNEKFQVIHNFTE